MILIEPYPIVIILSELLPLRTGRILITKLIALRLYFFMMLLQTISYSAYAQEEARMGADSLSKTSLYAIGDREVNQCTPWHHLKCVFITGSEVYADGRKGKTTRHWWRMSYIGRACLDRYGKAFGTIFEGIFVVPHYIGVGIGNGAGLLVHVMRGSKEQVAQRRAKRRARKGSVKEH